MKRRSKSRGIKRIVCENYSFVLLNYEWLPEYSLTYDIRDNIANTTYNLLLPPMLCFSLYPKELPVLLPHHDSVSLP